MNDTTTTEIYSLPHHAVLPIFLLMDEPFSALDPLIRRKLQDELLALQERVKKTDRKSTRLNSSHLVISYAVFCLKKRNNVEQLHRRRRSSKIRLGLISHAAAHH